MFYICEETSFVGANLSYQNALQNSTQLDLENAEYNRYSLYCIVQYLNNLIVQPFKMNVLDVVRVQCLNLIQFVLMIDLHSFRRVTLDVIVVTQVRV